MKNFIRQLSKKKVPRLTITLNPTKTGEGILHRWLSPKSTPQHRRPTKPQPKHRPKAGKSLFSAKARHSRPKTSTTVITRAHQAKARDYRKFRRSIQRKNHSQSQSQRSLGQYLAV